MSFGKETPNDANRFRIDAHQGAQGLSASLQPARGFSDGANRFGVDAHQGASPYFRVFRPAPRMSFRHADEQGTKGPQGAGSGSLSVISKEEAKAFRFSRRFDDFSINHELRRQRDGTYRRRHHLATLYKRAAVKVRPVDSSSSDGSKPGGSLDWRKNAIKSAKLNTYSRLPSHSGTARGDDCWRRSHSGRTRAI